VALQAPAASDHGGVVDRNLPSRVFAELRDVVGSPHVLTEPDVLVGYTTDWTGRFVGSTAAVVRPGSTAEVAAVVATCAAHGVALVAQGGNTGLVGGSVPLEGELVLSLTRLDPLDAIDRAASQVTAGAGVPIAVLQRAAAAHDLAYGVDLASRDSATVGGTVATNAGGLRVLRYGDTRAQVVGVEAVLGDGSIVSHLSGLVRDNTGYHLPSLLAGSEGTLGVVTRARLRLVPATTHRTVALLAFASTADAVASIAALRASCSTVEAIELFLPAGLELVCTVTGAPPPFASPDGHGAYLLVEAADRRDTAGDLADSVASLARVLDVAVAVDPARRAALWAYRERHTEAVNHVGTPHKLDVAVPLTALAPFLDGVPSVVAAVFGDARTWLFGHAADGNVHVNVTGVDPDDERVDEAVLRYTASLGGSISAEHGIGRAKTRWLTLNRSPEELAAFAALKRALDPSGILNPGVLVV
jgi:FAD/FMN-containing dehydrogenase